MVIYILNLLYALCLFTFILGLFLAKFNTSPAKFHSFIEKEQKSSVAISVTTIGALGSFMLVLYTSSDLLFLAKYFLICLARFSLIFLLTQVYFFRIYNTKYNSNIYI